MSARRRHYPGRAPAGGISGTRAAYDPCARPGCGHARVKHLTDGSCAAAVYFEDAGHQTWRRDTPGSCSCPAFSESEE